MSIAPLPNPKKLSYSGLKWQVRELARRMNLLTQMEAKTIESTGAPKFVFSEELARLDVPSVADVVTSLTDLKTAYDESITSCESTNAALTAQIEGANDYINENEPGVGGFGSTISDKVYVGGVLVGTVTLNIVCTSIDIFSVSLPKYTRHNITVNWICGQSQWPTPGAPQNVSGSSAYQITYTQGTTGGPVNTGTGVAPWLFLASGINSGSFNMVMSISPFSSTVSATIFNTTSFQFRVNNTYSPKSAYKTVFHRATGGDDPNNGTLAPVTI